jgi:ferrous iron transport protein B
MDEVKQRFIHLIFLSFPTMHCHTSEAEIKSQEGIPIVLVGNPNVGKSVIFGALANRYVAVSNYPGTTVEIARGNLHVNGHVRPVIDTPGIQSIVSFSDDERVTRDILLSYNPVTVVQVVDTKNLRRGLLIALELAEAGLSFILNLNMADEAEARGIRVDVEALAQRLGVPVISTVATRGEGMSKLIDHLERASVSRCISHYAGPIEEAIAAIVPHLPPTGLEQRAVAVMLLAGDEQLLSVLSLPEAERAVIQQIRSETETGIGEPLAYAINRARLAAVDEIITQVVERRPTADSWKQRLGRWMVHPQVGWLILAVVLYTVYQFVGVLGAGTLVDLLETHLFGEILNPWATRLVEAVIPFALVQEFLVGDYGAITMALTYGLAIVMPIVSTFFIAFSLLEDSGYLPRLAVMLDRTFRLMGLNGKAVLPMILGLGCDTMATMSTRILESRKERLQVTLLLALAVPCSAQLGVMLGMIAGLGLLASSIWAGVVVATLLSVGYLSAQVLPGKRSDFILELPPLRLPSLRNIVIKTAARLEWYLKEVIPIFLLGTAFLFVLDKLSLLSRIENFFAPVIVHWLGLPVEVTGAFLVGFLRRDYGATELYNLSRAGGLDPVQVLVSLVVITLFIPCIANLLMIVKEHGGRVAVAVALFIFPFAFAVGGLLNWFLRTFHVPIG